MSETTEYYDNYLLPHARDMLGVIDAGSGNGLEKAEKARPVIQLIANSYEIEYYEAFDKIMATSTAGHPIDHRATGTGYHDVVMVAFDISGKSAEYVHQFLHSQMPRPENEELEEMGIRLDSWWVANDERYDNSDCDSAVFVAKGNQRKARKLLRQHGLLA